MANPYVFGRLYPANDLAEKAFNQIAHKIKTGPQQWNPVARRYIKINTIKDIALDYTSDTESEGGSGPKPVAESIWRGHYCLSFDVPPTNPRLGWVVGGGTFGTAEIVLTEKKKWSHISSQHAKFAHNYTSGALVLSVSENNLVVVDGKEVHGEQRTIWSPETRLTFGRLDYKLVLERVDNHNHLERLTQYKLQHGITDEGFPITLMSTPAETDFIHKDYIIKNPMGWGTSSIVFAGEHRKTGAAVAIKKFKRTEDNWMFIEAEISMAYYLGDHPRICKLVDMMSPDDDSESLNFRETGVDEIYLIFSPLALGTVEQLIGSQQPADAEFAKTKIFWQCLDGIEFIHSKGVIHRDIKPTNMSVVSLNPPRAKLIDFGSAIASMSSYNHLVGTAIYHAPEIYQLAKGLTYQPYGRAADMFAFGLSAYRLFCGLEEWWSFEPDVRVLKSIAEDLSLRSRNVALMNMIRGFLVEDPQQRTTARQAKSYPGVPYAPGDGEETETLTYDIASLNVNGHPSQIVSEYPQQDGKGKEKAPHPLSEGKPQGLNPIAKTFYPQGSRRWD